MKKTIFLLMAMIVLCIATAEAAQPTVTVTTLRNDTQTGLSRQFLVKNYAWTNTSTSALDTARIYLTGTTPFDLSQYAMKDSLITFEFKSSEGTANNVDHGLIIQATGREGTTITDADWHTIYTNATFASNAVKATVSVRVHRLTSLKRFRVLVYETQSGTDTNSDCVLRVVIPKQ